MFKNSALYTRSVIICFSRFWGRHIIFTDRVNGNLVVQNLLTLTFYLYFPQSVSHYFTLFVFQHYISSVACVYWKDERALTRNFRIRKTLCYIPCNKSDVCHYPTPASSPSLTNFIPWSRIPYLSRITWEVPNRTAVSFCSRYFQYRILTCIKILNLLQTVRMCFGHLYLKIVFLTGL